MYILKFVYDDLKSRHQSYLVYKLKLQLNNRLNDDEEENEWQFEIYRFLLAKKWNTIQTITSILAMIQWRIDNHIDIILNDQSVISRIELFEKLVPTAFHGHTKAYQPLYIEKTDQMNVDEILKTFTIEEMIQGDIYGLEYNCQQARDFSRQLRQHIETFAIIYDLNGMKLDIKKLLHSCKEIFYIDENYYPERLGQTFVLNPPTVFPVIWDMIKHFLDPVTKTKILVLKKGHETTETSLEYIDSEELPCEYGGNCHSYSTSPDCLPNINQPKLLRYLLKYHSFIVLN
ncbi:unnamed protein product [Adineta steineri]|uniref:CRAL-TRIO domain-containing protein n=1 Tax=Adineta steineri TaxID=433720 RepID=A0A819DCJ5_9BILA|nr:unnamed protein product [Adineta steineri]CAF3832282.1 unnamed protein product [Adineta steineri]